MKPEDLDRPGSLLPAQYSAPAGGPTRSHPLRGHITLWPKFGSVLTCFGIAVLWLWLLLSNSAATAGDNILSRVIAPFGLNIPYPILVTAVCWVAIVAFIWPILNILSAQVVFDGEGLYFADGIVSREQTTWHISRIETVEVFSPLIGRILGYGSLRIAATGGSELWVLGLKNPQLLAQAVLNAQAQEANRFRAAAARSL